MTLGTNLAAQKHADDMLKNNYQAHWGTDGLKPYMRYTMEGGYNYEAENGFRTITTWYGGRDPFYKRDPKEMLDQAERSLIDSPGHRTNILNKWHKKVNLGIAYDNEKLFLVQQFEGDYIRFTQPPTLKNGILSAIGETLARFAVANVQIWYDQTPHSLTIAQLEPTYAYNAGKPAAFLRPPPAPNSYYPQNQTQYTWESQGPDPYSLPADTGSTPNTSGISRAYPPMINSATVRWITAARWDLSGNFFAIQADLNSIVSQFGKGVYTVHIWGKIGEESVALTNYSIFVQ